MSSFNSRILNTLAAGAALAAAGLAFSPAANAQEYSSGAEISAGASYYSNSQDSEFDLSSWGARYHYDFSDRWGIEASYTSQDQNILDADVYEASARFTFFQNDRVRLFAFAGAGLLQYDYFFSVSNNAFVEISDDTAIYHAGMAAEIALGDRLYLRPDVRQRWAIDFFGPYDDSSNEASLAFGYRF